MNEELDYAEMLEIPVSTVNVVKKKSIFKHRPFFAPKEQHEVAPASDELKDLVVDSVNERVGAYTYTEDLTEPVKPEKKSKFFGKDKGSKIILTELIAVCVLAAAIFLTNIFMPTSAINTFLGTLTGNKKTEAEPTYNEITLSSVVSETSDAVVNVSESGVLSFTAKGSVYPVCTGKVASVTKNEDTTYTVEIAHTSTFTSVITGLSDVYSAEGTTVQGNIPFAYSDGENEVRVSMYDNGTLLNCYTLSGVVPVWNS
ncbi:MAG: M23 family metallopeptidase [Clostridia bacterium]|nr:M23 family metallopeptidase [Clostridia bacterium]